MELLELSDITAARRRIGVRVHRTPVFSSRTLGEIAGVRLFLKAELFQKTGSFKPRGVFNKLLSMSAEERGRGLVSLSAGNHAAALAYGAAAVGTRATIVMPASARAWKVEATKGYGGEVVLEEGDILAACLRIRDERGLTLVHPFDDRLVMAGQGTVGLEILEDVPDVDAIVVPVGGGGLIGGIAAAVKRQRPQVKVVGVEPRGANAMTLSLEAGRPVHIHPDTIADGLAAPFAGEHTLAHAQAFVDEVVEVGDEDIVAALALLMERTKLAAEPSGAAGLAALLSGAVRLPVGSCVVVVVSGGNWDRSTLAGVLSGHPASR